MGQEIEPLAHWAFDEGRGARATEAVMHSADVIEQAVDRGEFKPARAPTWRVGSCGSALMFDGYSTRIRRARQNFPRLSGSVSIEAWVAPRAFEYGDAGKLSVIVNQQDLPGKRGFALGMYRHGRWSFQFGDGKHWHEIWDGNHRLRAGEWSHLIATYDAQARRATLYLNGQSISEATFSHAAGLAAADADLLIGRHNDSELVLGVFHANMFNGLLDELKVYDQPVSASQAKAMFSACLRPHGAIPRLSFDDLRLDERQYAGDRYRPRYHAMPPGHWMNEPHAPLYFRGKYHLFYQHNPLGPFFHQIRWGHWSSDDLVHWNALPEALTSEDDDLAPDGIWSGSATHDGDGVPVLFFTAGNDSKTPNQAVGLARPRDRSDAFLERWVKHPRAVLTQDPSLGLSGDFRDPFVWRDDEADVWYLLIGSAYVGRRATAQLYSSKDLFNWKHHGDFYDYNHGKYPFLGPVWELPVFLPLGRYPDGEARYIFLVSPVGRGADVEVFYWIGRFDQRRGKFVPDHDAPQLIDYGDFHFTGPSGMIDAKSGRAILFTIAQGERSEQDNHDAGWAHNAGLPLELSLDENGGLRIEPIRELTSLRAEKLASFRDIGLGEANRRLRGVGGRMMEIILELEASTAANYGIKVAVSNDGSEQTVVRFDAKAGELTLDRTRSSLARNYGVNGGSLRLAAGEKLKLHIFIDHSMLEVYANARKTITSRIYSQTADATGLKLWADGALVVREMHVWRLDPIRQVVQ